MEISTRCGAHIQNAICERHVLHEKRVLASTSRQSVCVCGCKLRTSGAVYTQRRGKKGKKKKREERERERERKGLKTIREQRLKGPSWCLNDPSVTTKYQPERQTCWTKQSGWKQTPLVIAAVAIRTLFGSTAREWSFSLPLHKDKSYPHRKTRQKPKPNTQAAGKVFDCVTIIGKGNERSSR